MDIPDHETSMEVSHRKEKKAEALALLHCGLGEAIDTVRSIAHNGPLADLGVIHPARLLAAVDRYVAGDRDMIDDDMTHDRYGLR